jgi:hypothetical protein
MTDETSEEMSIKAKVVVYGREKRTRQPSPSGMDGAMQQSLMEKEDHETNATVPSIYAWARAFVIMMG